MTRKHKLTLYNHHPSLDIPLSWLERGCKGALDLIAMHRGPHDPALEQLEEIEISLLDDQSIGSLHEEYMAIPGPTDVITFQHGEICVSLDTALRQAPDYNHVWQEETLMYCIHGLLHLNGHEDSEAMEREVMHAAQEILFLEALNKAGPRDDNELQSP